MNTLSRPSRHMAGLFRVMLFLSTLLLFSGQVCAQTFNQIQFTLTTGNDDLRDNSSLVATIKGPAGNTLQVVTLKAQNAASWPNGSVKQVTAALNPALTRAAIGSVAITLSSHNGFAQSDDGWNVNGVSASLSNNGNGAMTLLNSSGAPIKRLIGGDNTLTLMPLPVAAPGTFNQIQFTIGTGGDDLRGDSSATATLQAANGATLQVITLKGQSSPGWPNNSSQVITAPLNTALTPAQIAHIVINLASHDGFAETDDNWNVNSVNVVLSNNGTGAHPLMSFSGVPLKRLTKSDPNLSLPPTATGVAGTFNQIRFVMATGNDDLRGDSSVTATLLAANGAVLQTLEIKNQSAPGWPNNSINTVTLPLSPALAPSSIASIVIRLISHNGIGETDDNWNLNGADISLSNNGTALQPLMHFSGAPLARLTGVSPTITLPPPHAVAGLGMTMPVTPPVETPDLDINPALPYGLLPFGYHVVPAGFADATAMLTGSCNKPTDKACVPSWHGQVSEQDGRLNPFLRANAASHDAKLLLVRAVWNSLGLPLPGSLVGMNCGVPDPACATALAQLAVTGRESFNTFVGWNPSFAPASSGPQVADLVQLLRQGYGGLPTVPANVSDAQLQSSATRVLTDAYQALWSIRSNDPAWRQFRLNSGWIAVSGEDDAPHRPVNVFTAPFPQFDLPVPVKISGHPFTLTGRFMIAAGQTLMNLRPGQAPTTAPAIPQVAGRFAVPDDNPAALLAGALRNKNVIVYIHGGGSRLEEAVPMAKQFVTQFGAWSNDVVVLSFDLPNSGYDDPMATPIGGGARFALDASSSAFENGPAGAGPANIRNFPVLNFTLNYINNLLTTLDNREIIDKHKVLAVMGGSLGGNTSLLLGMNPLPSTFHMDNPIAFSAPATAPGGAQPTIVSWSPTSMVSYHDDDGLVIGGNTCCNIGGPGPTWQPEVPKTRSDYFINLYFKGISLTGLPPDPEMWYRTDWNDNQGRSATASLITQSRFDRYEIYSPLVRLWTTSIDTEQVVFSFQDNQDATGHSYQPAYQAIRARLLLATGACDDYDNGDGTAPFAPPPAISTGTCAGHGLGNTGSNIANHQDIYGFTHDIAADMRNAKGRTLFLNDTGHSIHDERPAFFSHQIFDFLTTADNTINLTLRTGSDDLRWNSEVHAIVGLAPGNPAGTSLDFPLNYWFHPWPTASKSPNNPCGACYKLDAFHMASGSDGHTGENNFSIALPPGVSTNSVNSFKLEFIAGTSSAGNTTDHWNLDAVAACLPGSNGGFISDGFAPEYHYPTKCAAHRCLPVDWLSADCNCSPATRPPVTEMMAVATASVDYSMKD